MFLMYFWLFKYSLGQGDVYQNKYTVKPKIIKTPDIILNIFSLVGAGHYSTFM